MWIFLRFFRKYRTDFLFVFLCIIAFYMMWKTKNYQGRMINNSLINTSAYFNSRTRSITSYFDLKKKNQVLQEEIIRLQNSKQKASANLKYGLAPVQYMQVYKPQNYLIIGKEKGKEIKPKMLVISTYNSVIGEVVQVTAKSALVSTVMTNKLELTGVLKDGTLGIVFWDGSRYGFVKMKNVPSYVKVSKGDLVTTSGKGKFPKGIQIGKITKIDVDEATKFYTVTIQLATDFMRLEEVEIIQDYDAVFTDTLVQTIDSLSNESEGL